MELLPKLSTRKQERFCEEYIIDGNGNQAALRAGYSPKSARSMASQLLTNSNIKAHLKALRENLAIRNNIEIDELIQILAKQVRFDIAELYNEDGTFKDIHEIPLHIRANIEEITTDEIWEGFGADRVVIGTAKKIKTVNKQNAIEKLLRYLGAYEKDNEQKRTQIAIFQIPDNNRPNR